MISFSLSHTHTHTHTHTTSRLVCTKWTVEVCARGLCFSVAIRGYEAGARLQPGIDGPGSRAHAQERGRGYKGAAGSIPAQLVGEVDPVPMVVKALVQLRQLAPER